MRNILILLFIPVFAFGQVEEIKNKLTATGTGGVIRLSHDIVYSASSYNDSALALFDRWDVQPSNTVKEWYSELFDSIQYYNIDDTLAVLQIYAAHTEQAALLNILADEYNGTAVNSPVFAIDTGFTGDGATSYINSGFNPNTNSKFKLSCASFGVYSRTDNVIANINDMGSIGSGTTSYLKIKRDNNYVYYGVNSTTNFATANPYNSQGLYEVILRNDSARVNRNGAQILRQLHTPSSISNYNFYICSANNVGSAYTFSIRQFAVFFAGAALTDIQKVKLFEIIERFLDHKGSGVI